MKKETRTFSMPDCRLFNGYKPCRPFQKCPCTDPVPWGRRICIVNLDFMGDVLMTTALLPAISRKYPVHTIHWITRRNAVPVLENNPYLFKIWEWNDESRMILESMEFDTVFNADKSRNACAFTDRLTAEEKRGFGLNKNGVIIPLNKGAEYNFRMGIDDQLKFRENKRTGLDILSETWDLDYQQDAYVFELTDEEKSACRSQKETLGIPDQSFVVGLNTGCSNLYPHKKMTIEQHIALIEQIKALPDTVILLLGGKEDTERNKTIKEQTGASVIETPTEEGLRRGFVYENLCDCVVTGDTLGMHMAIALKKQVVVWFGVSCGAEIELYGRGTKIFSDEPCSPCWRRECDHLRCIQNLDLDKIFDAVVQIHHAHYQ